MFFMGILQELSKRDSDWRLMAVKISKDKAIADDLVQDMYLKLMNKKRISDGLVYKTIYNLFIDKTRKVKPTSIAKLHYIESKEKVFEPDDKEKQILDAYEQEKWYRKELLQDKIDLSYRQIEKKYVYINYGFAFKEIKTARENILKNINE